MLPDMPDIPTQPDEDTALEHFRNLVKAQFSINEDTIGIHDDYDFYLMLEKLTGELASAILDSQKGSLDPVQVLVKINALVELWAQRNINTGFVSIG